MIGGVTGYYDSVPWSKRLRHTDFDQGENLNRVQFTKIMRPVVDEHSPLAERIGYVGSASSIGSLDYSLNASDVAGAGVLDPITRT